MKKTLIGTFTNFEGLLLLSAFRGEIEVSRDGFFAGTMFDVGGRSEICGRFYGKKKNRIKFQKKYLLSTYLIKCCLRRTNDGWTGKWRSSISDGNSHFHEGEITMVIMKHESVDIDTADT